MFTVYFLLFIVIVVVPLLLALWLLRHWTFEATGRDLETESLRKRDWRKLSSEQQILLLVLTIPAGLLLLIVVIYLIAGVLKA